MFKKNISVVTSRVLSGKDVKKLRTDAAAAFPALSDVAIDSLVPPKASVTLVKLSNRTSVYSLTDDGIPLFFEAHDQLLPTVYTLWQCPHALPALTTYSEVSPKVLGGADLFLAGVIVPPEGLPDFQRGTPLALSVPGHPFPFAVGVMECNRDEARRSGMKGRGLQLMHAYTDQLWGLGPKTVPHSSFTPTRIFPHQEAGADAPPAAAQAADSAADSMQQLSVTDTAAAAPATAGVTSAASNGAPTSNGAAAASDAAATSATAAADRQPTAGRDAQDAAADAGPALDLSSPDAIAEHCLLFGLHSVADAELPIMTSDFWSKHMLPGKPEGLDFDIKKTSYKKLGKLLSVHEKKKWLTQKQIHKQDHIILVNRTHEAYTAFAPVQQAAAPAAEPSDRSGAKSAEAVITVTSAYRVPTSLQPICSSGTRDQLYSETEVGQALRLYATSNDLMPAGGAAELKLDRLLLAGLFNKKEPQMEGDLHPVADTQSRLLGKLQLWSRITRATQQEVKEVLHKGAVRNILVQLEDRAGGRKHITRISGMETFGIDPDELSTALQRRFQSSASVAKLPGKNEQGKEIALQGDQLHNAAQFLMQHYGLPQKYVDTKNRSKG